LLSFADAPNNSRWHKPQGYHQLSTNHTYFNFQTVVQKHKYISSCKEILGKERCHLLNLFWFIQSPSWEPSIRHELLQA
jgi:hypothetical protein